MVLGRCTGAGHTPPQSCSTSWNWSQSWLASPFFISYTTEAVMALPRNSLAIIMMNLSRTQVHFLVITMLTNLPFLL